MTLTLQNKLAPYLAAAALTTAVAPRVDALLVDGTFNLGQSESASVPPGSQNTEYWRTHVIHRKGVHCIALGNNAYLTAAHCRLPSDAYNVMEVRTARGDSTHLIAFRHDTLSEEPALPSLLFSTSIPEHRSSLLISSHGKQGWSHLRGSVSQITFNGATVSTHVGFFDATLGEKGPQRNGMALVHEGDSGGAVFQFDNSHGDWTLLGVVVAKESESFLGYTPWASPSGAFIETSFESGIAQTLIAYREGTIHGENPSPHVFAKHDVVLGTLAVAVAAVAASRRKRTEPERESPFPYYL